MKYFIFVVLVLLTFTPARAGDNGRSTNNVFGPFPVRAWEKPLCVKKNDSQKNDSQLASAKKSELHLFGGKLIFLRFDKRIDMKGEAKFARPYCSRPIFKVVSIQFEFFEFY